MHMMPPGQPLWLTLSGSNNPCFEHISVVSKVFEPLVSLYDVEIILNLKVNMVLILWNDWKTGPGRLI